MGEILYRSTQWNYLHKMAAIFFTFIFSICHFYLTRRASVNHAPKRNFSRWGVLIQKPEKATETVAESAEAEGWQKNKTPKKRCHRQPSTGPNCCQYVCNANKLYLIKGTRVTQRGHTASATALSREHLHLHLRDRHGPLHPLFHT